MNETHPEGLKRETETLLDNSMRAFQAMLKEMSVAPVGNKDEILKRSNEFLDYLTAAETKFRQFEKSVFDEEEESNGQMAVVQQNLQSKVNQLNYYMGELAEIQRELGTN
ncbi:hypothetical protein EIN_475560 [Entamoeba invadens IP1]|uniref:Uncharacterized protein n=1 Tax=Entamoeba invadens IP1 TaxID=370355 RepID=A0A0A1U3R3_ENTIV|nr:hypothetical protein EIN_475560 [Entamoeba invadens IP1]ELP88864.1 hypothetical protein EIN_475560 [Entamoeba invadens IP1]|eukprot:XP_004255635.1 hypothetical protein EIN_475560 [Entamoeba invadens IP1]